MSSRGTFLDVDTAWIPPWHLVTKGTAGRGQPGSAWGWACRRSGCSSPGVPGMSTRRLRPYSPN